MVDKRAGARTKAAPPIIQLYIDALKKRGARLQSPYLDECRRSNYPSNDDSVWLYVRDE